MSRVRGWQVIGLIALGLAVGRESMRSATPEPAGYPGVAAWPRQTVHRASPMDMPDWYRAALRGEPVVVQPDTQTNRWVRGYG